MAIRFKCHHCKKVLAVKDHLAGRKVLCSGCKKPIVIPRPKPVAAEVEELAAKFLGDSPENVAARPQAAVQSLKFTCEYCDEEVEAPASEAGTKMPCPECKHIIRVPDLKVDKPKDWRDLAKKGPSAALINQPEQLENAWGTEQKSKVSGSALVEAGAIPEPRGQSFALGIWLKRGFWSFVVVGLISMVFRGMTNARNDTREKEALQAALDMISPHGKEPAKVKLSGDWVAEIHRAAGELYCAKHKPADALQQFRTAFANLRDAPSGVERDLLLIDLVLAQIELGGTDDEILSKERLPWTEVTKEISPTLEAISADPRKQAMRLVGSRLVDRNQLQLAIGIAGPTREQQIGLILANKAALEIAAKDPDVKVSQPAAKTLSTDKQLEKIVPAPKADDKLLDPVARQAHVEGLARQRKFKEALDLACLVREKTPTESMQCLEACVAGAELALADRKAPHNVAEAAAFVLKGLEFYKTSGEKELESRPWLVFELILAGIGAEVAEVEELTKSLKADSVFMPRIRLDLFRQKLAKSTVAISEPPEGDADTAQREALSSALMWEAMARHNARLNRPMNEILKMSEGADERLRPFLLVGFALGQHSR